MKASEQYMKSIEKIVRKEMLEKEGMDTAEFFTHMVIMITNKAITDTLESFERKLIDAEILFSAGERSVIKVIRETEVTG